MRHSFAVITIVVALVAAAPLAAQQARQAAPSAIPPVIAPDQTPPPAPPSPAVPPGQSGGQRLPGQAPSAQTMPPQPPRAELPSSFQNIRLDLTLSDTSEGAGKKTVSMIVVDNRSGRIRSSGGGNSTYLNVDARPSRTSDGRIVVDLTIQYHPKETNQSIALLDESMIVAVTDGKPMMVSQSSDATGDRKVTVELTATVIK